MSTSADSSSTPKPSRALSNAWIAGGAIVLTSAVGAIAYYFYKRSKPRPVSASLTIQELRIYPVKSCRGVSVKSAEMGPGGFKMDRKWMIVDSETNVFVTQRECPEMARIGTSITANNELVLRIPYYSDVKFVFALSHGDVGGIRRELSANHRLDASNFTDFADGYPVLVASTSSLKKISKESKSDLPITRFRPNILVANEVAWEEDDWRVLRFDGSAIQLHLVKPCSRCEITTIDPETGQFPSGDQCGQPLKTLQRVHANDVGAALFGMNAIPVKLPAAYQASSSPSSSSSFSSSLSSSSSSPSDSTSLTAGVSYVWPATHSIRHSQEEDASSSNLLLLRVGQRVQVVARK